MGSDSDSPSEASAAIKSCLRPSKRFLSCFLLLEAALPAAPPRNDKEGWQPQESKSFAGLFGKPQSGEARPKRRFRGKPLPEAQYFIRWLIILWVLLRYLVLGRFFRDVPAFRHWKQAKSLNLVLVCPLTEGVRSFFLLFFTPWFAALWAPITTS